MIKIISVVVPVYNVEKYLEKLISDLLHQDIAEDYEVILVDDGSTDSSGRVCDEYADKHDIIHVIHKENGGLSDARNCGVRNSNGTYITFIDSDDRVSKDYLRALYTPIKKYNADLSTALNGKFYEKEIPVDKLDFDLDKCEVYENPRDLLRYALMGKKGSLSAWAKMYRKEILIEYPFPYGKLYEDMEVLYNIFNSCKVAVFVNCELYYYLQRDNSIVRSNVTEKHLYGIYSCRHMFETEKSANGDLENEIRMRIVMQACGHLPNLCACNNKTMFNDIKKLVKSDAKIIVVRSNATMKLRLRALSYLMPTTIALKYAGLLFKAQAKRRKIRRKYSCK